MKKISFIFSLLPLFCVFFSCNSELTGIGDNSPSVVSALESKASEKSAWTFLVYMAADNNLESDAITDFNEMENSSISDSVTVLVLFDRAQGYDASNGDWSGTRLYRIVKDEQKNKTLIVSERLSCEDLGLSSESETELDMSKPATLSAFESFARKNYPADNYALFIWGHGTGWRSSPVYDCGDCPSELSRAVAIESETGTYMSISSLRSAICEGMEEDRFSVIGFDTCFGMCIECAYELKDCAKYMFGTPALVPESGWNYTKIFDSFCESEQSVQNLIDSVNTQYQESYGSYAYASFTCVDLSEMENVVDVFSEYSKSLSDLIVTKDIRNSIFEELTKNTVSYHATEYPTDFYFDIYDASSVLTDYLSGEELQKSLDKALSCSWSASGNSASLGVFFCVYKTASVIQSSHPASYISGSRDTLLSEFVSQCTEYVPSSDNKGSLLDKLFYTNFSE
ncbi:MAG: hypothetical protein II821_09080 [Treponema sp.]|nr:hypothetical protein [Treponema sp.]